MPTQTPLPDNHPLRIAFEAYKKTPEYANTRKWVLHPEHVDGSLWAAFEMGWEASPERAYEALKELIKYNGIRNDLDAYLLHIAEWGLGERDSRPSPEDYGIRG